MLGSGCPKRVTGEAKLDHDGLSGGLACREGRAKGRTHMPRTNEGPPRRGSTWIALAGAVVIVAIAVGLLGSAGASTRGGRPGGGGYGGGGCVSNGYGQPCKPDVKKVSTTPAKPVQGQGFDANFNTASGGK